MRVTAETRKATRGRILEAARELFASQGFPRTTTRDLARASGIASGTLFNYFPSKEAIAMDLVDEALKRGEVVFERHANEGTSIDEDLFAHAASGLRELRPCRGYIRPVLETSLGPIARAEPGNRREDAEDSARVRHLETVHALALKHGHGELSPMSMQLYWTLYTGVLTFWSEDASPHQEDTLALLDESLRMFVGWLGSGGHGSGQASPRGGDGGDGERQRD